ncbi:MAG: alpha/beta hydrolase [Clostridia bacterium]|nr:alpha/beta hydrolase [Clostridia bacterium]
MEMLNQDGLARSEGYAGTMKGVILPYINARRTDRTIPGDGGVPLFTSRFDADRPRGTVLIVHGFTENVDKFAEVIHSLLKGGLSVAAYDQRGHGRSGRAEGLDGLSLTHVRDFDEYVRDMDIVRREVLAGMPKPWRVFCHSMGGAVTALYLERHPGVFDRAAMCAPMIAPNLSGMPKPVAQALCAVEGALKNARKRVFVSRPYAEKEQFETACANGRARFEWYEDLRFNTPQFQNNGPTYGWLREAIDVTKDILTPGAVEKIDAKVLLFTAGLDDVVLPGPQRDFIARVKNGVHRVVKGAKHEIYRSEDEVLFPWWHEVAEFLKN